MSDLVGNPEDLFFHNEAHIVYFPLYYVLCDQDIIASSHYTHAELNMTENLLKATYSKPRAATYITEEALALVLFILLSN